MSTEATPAVQQDADPATTAPDAITSSPATQPKTEGSVLGPTEGNPSDKGTAEAVPNLSNVTKEEKVAKGDVLVESHPMNEGVLNLKAPGIKGLIPTKKYFWFSNAPLEEKNLIAYINSEKAKDIAHANASHATQTGNGLLFYAKRAEDKDHPQGIFNLADMSDVAKGTFNDFNASVNGHKYTFQAVTKAERDGWLVALDTKIAEAKSSREAIVGSEGYKTQHEKYSKPVAAAASAPSKTRSLSRPKKEAKPGTPKETAPVLAAEPIADKPVTTDPTEPKKGGHGTEAAAAATSAAAGGVAATRKDSSEDDKKDKKSRSQSRGNKRSSLFGGLLAKKEESDDKKAARKAEKDVKNEETKENKAAKKEDHNVIAAAKSGDEKKERALRKEEKKEEKARKEEEAAAAAAKKEQEKAKLEEAAVVEKEKGKTQQEEKEAEKLEKKAEKEADKADKHVAKAEELHTEAAEKKEAAASHSTAARPSSTTREKPTKRVSVFGGLFGKKESATSPTEKITKDEPTSVSDTAPRLDNPVPPISTETRVATNDGKPVAKPASETPAPTSATTPTDKRRSAFFGNLGTKKEKRSDTTSGDELTDGEKKKQSGGFGGLLRKASRAAPKKEPKEPRELKEQKTDAADTPLPASTSYQAATNGETAVTDSEHTANKPPEAPPAEDIPVAAVPKPEETAPIETKA